MQGIKEIILFLGIGSLLLYYRYFHPTGQIEIFKTKQAQIIAVSNFIFFIMILRCEFLNVKFYKYSMFSKYLQIF